MRRSQRELLISQESYWTAVRNLDYKLLLIPVAFILLRLWSIIDSTIYIYTNMELSNSIHTFLVYLSVSTTTFVFYILFYFYFIINFSITERTKCGHLVLKTIIAVLLNLKCHYCRVLVILVKGLSMLCCLLCLQRKFERRCFVVRSARHQKSVHTCLCKMSKDIRIILKRILPN